jgi:hypothetical protein
MKICRALAVFSFLVVAFPLESQQPLVGLIQGTIENQQGDPIPSASLMATNLDSIERETHSTVTDSRGIYQFVDVEPGRYSIVVTMKDYRDYKVPLVAVHDSETVKMTVIRMSR